MDHAYLLLKYLFLGLFQGFTEPIPISSSGHLQLAKHFFGIEMKDLSFELLVNSASLLAVLVIYRADIMRLATNGLNYVKTRQPEDRSEFMFIIYLIIATIPAGVIGVVFGDFIEQQLSSVRTVAITLIITGIALWTIRNLRGRKNDGDMRMRDAIIIGCAQAIALIPGISRSGATIVAAMGLGMKQETALRFSFLLFIPVSVGGMVLGFSDILGNPNLQELAIPYTVAFIGSFVMSYFSLKWFMNIMAQGNLKYFAIYCFIVGPLALIFL
ncbi:undecaprenyl-diphosphate phosphatase [Bacillus badius]|uniref:Undecaprenyl-diphosphatase n=1 Tax=Bacillus badius TaxID=1455 RepID=A0ABR5ASA1_BACBA|nr:undecaprenyl-diphosphate phosphatase [Bacillus badius]KIL73084.1 Undecaprenyl-diphosphatase [Bacillus badius]KIL77631.1 Undecaprenyl-diphosphatase [Bacillus badius]KZR59080.1 UDP pyrophosphate phosphatase [Bacillus badius]MED0667892.1 undecaprenyl-diphosphate phosphatase [Bacillus badius]MED4717791.1 undecaprenyl-diphosphate phosphatase [Bacillus badius]